MQFENNPKKSLGQNFLIDKNIINKIIKIGNIDNDKVVMEIGPGYGNLTEAINEMSPKKIFAIEKDKKLFLFLKDKFRNQKNVSIINDDILNIIKKKNLKKNIIIFGNLPYNISTQILAKFICIKEWPPFFKKIIFMFQKEVADRILAKYNTKEYGRISVLANFRLEMVENFKISRNCFFSKASC